MILLRSLLFNVGFYLWTTVILLICFPLLLGPPAWIVAAHEIWTNGIIGLLRIVDIRVEFRGFDRLPEPPYILASKHQSALDTLIFHKKVYNPAAVLKRELTWIPFYGWYVRKVGTIQIDRKGRDRALRRMLKKAARFRDQGRVILIFPEGTRTSPGQRKRYTSGVAGLYRHLQVPVVPVALNSGLFWPRRKFLRFPGTVVIECLDPIPPGLDRKTFMTRLTDAIEGETDRLIEEAGKAGARDFPTYPS